jgi:putative CocE/NonD family hydrolase
MGMQMKLSLQPFLPVSLILSCLFLLTACDIGEENRNALRAVYIRTNYDKQEVRIPMRDSVRLFTSIYTPKDTTQTYPFLLVRTPYRVAPYGRDAYRHTLAASATMEQQGYIFVFQDVRGRFLSEGDFVNMRPHIAAKQSPADIDESTDTYDTIDWLLANSARHNGRVGMRGISYPGFYVSAGSIDSHPALRAVSPQAPIADWFWDDMHHHGAQTLALTFRFFSSFGVPRPEPTTEWPPRFRFPTPDGYNFYLALGPLSNANKRYFKREIPFWNALMEHPNYDEFWQQRNILPHLKNIRAAVLVVGGWFDAEDLYGPLQTYQHIERQNPNIRNHLVMGPWSHGAWARSQDGKIGDLFFPASTGEYFREEIESEFFYAHLHQGRDPEFSEARVYDTGRSQWSSFAQWPPAESQQRELFLGAGGRLQPAWKATQKTYAAYCSDPAKPVPYTQEVTVRWARNYMTEDQRFAGRRPDVLVFTSDTLKEDLTVAGPLLAEIWISTSAEDLDVVVKVIDVLQADYPPFPGEQEIRGDQQTLIRGEIFRGRFRNSYTHPQPFTPHEATLVRVPLQDIFHTFRRGHRIIVQIQSSWFPLFDRNPQAYVDNINYARQQDFTAAEHRVYFAEKKRSRLQFRVLPEKR